jgi:hypothetical protein
MFVAEHGRAAGLEWYQAHRQGTETPPPRRGSDSPSHQLYDQYPSTPGFSGPPSRRSTDDGNYATPPIATSDYSGSYFSQYNGRNPTSPVSGQLGGFTAAMKLSTPSGRRDSVAGGSHPYLKTSRRPSVTENQTIPSMSLGYARARSPLGIPPIGGGGEQTQLETLGPDGRIVAFEGLPRRDPT